MAQAETVAQTATAQPQTPTVGKSLFWDDLRIGLQVLSAGAPIVVLGALVAHFASSTFGPAIVLVGMIGTILGVKICCSTPEETGVSVAPLAGLVAGTFAVLATIIGWFTGLPQAGVVVAVLGGVAYVVVAFEMYASAKYLNYKSLVPLALYHLITTVIVAILFVALSSTSQLLMASRTYMELISLGLVSFTTCVAWQLSSAIGRAQVGQAVESTVTEAAEGQSPSTVADDKPTPPPMGAPYFNDEQYNVFQADDASAGGAIVGLMTAVFTVGVVIYAIIALITW
ncbi:MAG: hypothetical protein ACFCD0_13325 [Gemmataceae bacterium]